MLNTLINDPNFKGSPVEASLRETLFGFVDVGARGGAHGLIEPAAGAAAVMCFEPDPPEFARLTEELKNWPFAASKVVQTALSNEAGDATLYITDNPNNISLLKPAISFRERYGNVGLNITQEMKVSTRTLDDVLFAADAGPHPWGELLKVDAQGADYLILQGAQKALSERVVAVVCEACFIELYTDQKLFSDLDVFLRQFGFAFYGFLETSMRSQRLVDKRQARGRERLFWADAVFFKDPLSAAAPKLTARQLHALFVSAILCGHYDYALELALKYWAKGEEETRVRALIAGLAAYPASRTSEEVRALARAIERDPANANVHAGRYVDALRTFADYRDIRK